MKAVTMARPAALEPVGNEVRDPTVTSDDSYRNILGSTAWARLKPQVRTRFSQKPLRGKSIRYEGVMATVELSLTGWLFAHVCRLIGTPISLYRGTNIPMMIELTLDDQLQGVAWNRRYLFPGKPTYTVRSTKCKGQGNEILEYIGSGFRMRLELSEVDGGLVFTSSAYELEIAGWHIQLPALITPGVTTVTHTQIAGNRFRFSLSVDHPVLGCTIYQDGEFYSVVSDR